MRVEDDLKPHNLEAFQEINKMIKSGTKKIAIPRATGSGKTYLMGALAEKYNNERKLVLEPTRPLLDSIKEKFDEFGITNTDFITYQKLIRMSDEDIAAMDYKVIFLDEFHHGTAPVWGMKINYLMETHSDSIIFGTSATTVRNDGVDVVESLFEGNAVGELPLSTAIARKVLPCPHYITAIYRLDDEFEKLKKHIKAATNTKEEKKEFYEKMKTMQSHFEKSYGIPTILNKYIKVKNGKYLVFFKNKKHLDAMRNVVIDWFKTAGIKNVHSYAVYSDYPDKEKDYKAFCEDNSDSCKILFSINMLSEGLHIEDVSGVLMLRTTMSDIVYCQQLGRVLEAGNLDKYLVVFDFVNNFSAAGDGAGLLKEIKDAVAREKESDPDYDDSEFEDIDTFFVLDQVVEIQEMFKEIEGRLQGSWDLYIKALKQYKEREGDCDVPYNHIEVVEGVNVKLGQWCMIIRGAKRGSKSCILTREMEKQLNQIGFVWGISKAAYYDIFYNNFIIHIRMYKKNNGHVNIKARDVMDDGYNIGRVLTIFKRKYKKNKLSNSEINQLETLGVYLGDSKEKEFKEKMELAKQAVDAGVTICRTNEKYNGVNLYDWIIYYVKKKFQNGELSNREILIVEKLINKPLYRLFGNFVKVVDMANNKQIGIFKSQNKAARMIKEKYNFKINCSGVGRYLKGKVTTPYKGRFMFYYATDEEVKKYLEDGKAS